MDPEKESRIVNIGYLSPDPAEAARVANAVAQAYVKQSLELRSQTVGEASTWLTEQVKQQRKLVEASEAALQQYRQEHGADVLGDRKNGEQPSIVVQKLGELQQAVTRARSETIEKETQAAQLAAIEAYSGWTRYATGHRFKLLHSGIEGRSPEAAAAAGAGCGKAG